MKLGKMRMVEATQTTSKRSGREPLNEKQSGSLASMSRAKSRETMKIIQARARMTK